MIELCLVSDLTNRLYGRLYLELILWLWANSLPMSRSNVKQWFRLTAIRGL